MFKNPANSFLLYKMFVCFNIGIISPFLSEYLFLKNFDDVMAKFDFEACKIKKINIMILIDLNIGYLQHSIQSFHIFNNQNVDSAG